MIVGAHPEGLILMVNQKCPKITFKGEIIGFSMAISYILEHTEWENF